MAWTQVTLKSGANVALYLQQFGNECGPSCVAMIGRLFGRGMDIAPARAIVGAVDYNRPPGGGDMMHDWQQDWAYMTSLTQALSRYGVRMAYTRKALSAGNYKQFAEGRSVRNPGILRVAWPDGSGHFVVSLGTNGAAQQNFIEILDPAYGYQRVPLADFPVYKPRDQATRIVAATGTLDRFWSVETT